VGTCALRGGKKKLGLDTPINLDRVFLLLSLYSCKSTLDNPPFNKQQKWFLPFFRFTFFHQPQGSAQLTSQTMTNRPTRTPGAIRATAFLSFGHAGRALSFSNLVFEAFFFGRTLQGKGQLFALGMTKLT